MATFQIKSKTATVTIPTSTAAKTKTKRSARTTINTTTGIATATTAIENLQTTITASEAASVAVAPPSLTTTSADERNVVEIEKISSSEIEATTTTIQKSRVTEVKFIEIIGKNEDRPQQTNLKEQRVKCNNIESKAATTATRKTTIINRQPYHSRDHHTAISTTTTTTTNNTNDVNNANDKEKIKQQKQQQQENNFYQHHHHKQSCHCCGKQHIQRTCAFRTPIGALRYLATNFNLTIDYTVFIMITMLVVVTVVISENAVYAAQRDSFKHKDPNSLSNNANAIPNGLSGISNSNSNGNINSNSNVNVDVNGNGNGNAASTSNTNNISNGSAHAHVHVHAGNGDGVGVGDGNTYSGNANIISGNADSNFGASSILNAITSSSSSSSMITTIRSTIASGSLHKGSATSGLNRNAIESYDESRNTGPYFDKAASKNVTALLGKTAYLNCRVKNLGNKTMLLQVSWVRHRDIHLLTVGRYTYTSDQRFRAIHQPQTEDWILQIKYPQHRDSGIYECQVSTTPHMSHYIHLNVVEPSTEIIGAPDLYIESGSTINLTCVILNSPEPPAYIFWNHNNAIINYDSPRGGVSVVTNKGETTTSFLLIKSARPSDSGHYQCNPSNAKPRSVTVHVLNGEFPAAMQRAVQSHRRMSQNQYALVCLSIYWCTLAYYKRYIHRLPHYAGSNVANSFACNA